MIPQFSTSKNSTSLFKEVDIPQSIGNIKIYAVIRVRNPNKNQLIVISFFSYSNAAYLNLQLEAYNN